MIIWEVLCHRKAKRTLMLYMYNYVHIYKRVIIMLIFIGSPLRKCFCYIWFYLTNENKLNKLKVIKIYLPGLIHNVLITKAIKDNFRIWKPLQSGGIISTQIGGNSFPGPYVILHWVIINISWGLVMCQPLC